MSVRKKHPILKTVCIILLVIVLCLGTVAAEALISFDGSNPYSRIILGKELSKSVESITRLDGKGYLYYMDYTGNYYSPVIEWMFKQIGVIKEGGCSAFEAFDENGNTLYCRNYDLYHKDGNGDVTGLNLIMHLTPDGKYESINVIDASWLSFIGLTFYGGCLDDGKTNLTPVAILPYLCMDGMNEKGFAASVLALDIKEGETPVKQSDAGKDSMIQTIIMRHMIDECATVEEAVAYAQSVNALDTFGNEYHVFIADATGKSAVLEWRHNTFTVTYQDACTNFYVSSDDACDLYIDGLLKEAFTAPETNPRGYSYGYGHGFERFKTLAAALERKSENNGTAVMSAEEARALLETVSQTPDPEDPLSSCTQYSVIYDQTNLTARLWVMQDYSKEFDFGIHGIK